MIDLDIATPAKDYLTIIAFWISLSVLLGCISFAFIKMYKPRRSKISFLSSLEFRKIYKQSAWQRIKREFGEIYLPSWASGTLLAASLSLVFVVALAVQYFAGSIENSSASIGSLQSLDAGIALIFVPITTFAIGLSSRRTESAVSTAEVLLRQTYLFPVTISVLSLLASFSIIRVPWVARGIIGITVSLAIFTEYRLCICLLDEENFSAAALSLLKDKVRSSIVSAVEARLSRASFLKQLDSKEIQYYWGTPTGQPLLEVHAQDFGLITDIDMARLDSFCRDLERMANNNGYSYTAMTKPLGVIPRSDLALFPTDERPLTINRQRYIFRTPGDNLTERSTKLVAYAPELVPDPVDQKRLSDTVLDAFKISGGNKHSDRIERYLGLIKDEALSAVLKDQKTYYLKNLLVAFETVAITFAEEMQKTMGGHSLQAANAERGNLLGGWTELTWLIRYLSEVFRAGCKSDNAFVAKLVAEAPFATAYKLVGYRDALVFEQYTAFFRMLYLEASERAKGKIRDMLINLSRSLPQDIGDTGIGLEITRQETDANSLERVGSFATIMTIRYVELMVLAYRQKDLESFASFCSSLRDFLDSPYIEMKARGSGTLLNATRTANKADLGSFKAAQEREAKLQAILASLDEQKKSALFSVGSIIMSERPYPDDGSRAQFLREVDRSLSNDPDSIVNVFVSYQHSEQKNAWAQVLAHEAGPFDLMDDDGSEYLLYLLLRGAETNPALNSPNFALPDVDEMVNLASAGIFQAELDGFRDDRDRWRALIPDSWLPSVARLGTHFAKLVETRKRREEDEIVRSPLNETFIANFKVRFHSEFRKQALLRQIFLSHNAFESTVDVDQAKRDASVWGVSRLEPRKIYTTRSDIYKDWPESYARNLANSESESVAAQILRKLPDLDLGSSTAKPTLDEVLASLKARNFLPNVFFAPVHSALGDAGQSTANFAPHWALPKNDRTQNLLGKIKFEGRLVPVFPIRPRDAEVADYGCALQLPGALVWRQYLSSAPLDQTLDRLEFFNISVEGLLPGSAMRAELEGQNPPWLRREADPGRFLSTHVVLKIVEHFSIEAVNLERGFKFRLA